MNDPKLNLPNNAITNASELIVEVLPDDATTEFDGAFHAISDDWVEPLADHLQHLTAHIIASLINAGSERDAIMESEPLHDALVAIIRDYSHESALQ